LQNNVRVAIATVTNAACEQAEPMRADEDPGNEVADEVRQFQEFCGKMKMKIRIKVDGGKMFEFIGPR
jgi:hypothetical protein